MKKIITILAVIAIIMSCTSCGMPASKASKKGLSIAKQAVEIMDKYLDGKETGDSTDTKLEDLYEQMRYAGEYAGTQMTEEQKADYEIHRILLFAWISVGTDKHNGNADTYEKVINERNRLAELAGLDER